MTSERSIVKINSLASLILLSRTSIVFFCGCARWDSSMMQQACDNHLSLSWVNNGRGVSDHKKWSRKLIESDTHLPGSVALIPSSPCDRQVSLKRLALFIYNIIELETARQITLTSNRSLAMWSRGNRLCWKLVMLTVCQEEHHQSTLLSWNVLSIIVSTLALCI